MSARSWSLSDLKQKDLLFQTALSVGVRIVAALAAFIVSIVIGRQLGATDAGYFFLAFSLVTFFAAITRLGLDNTVIRFTGAAFAEDAWGTVNTVLNRSLIITFITGVPITLIFYLMSDYLAIDVFDKPKLAPVLQAMSPGIIGLALLTLIAMSLQGMRRVIASVMTINIIANVLLILALLLLGITSAADTAWVYSCAALLTVFIGYTLYRRGIVVGKGSVSWQDIFRSCLPLWVVVFMGQLVQWSGQFIAGAWVTPAEVAQLAVAQRTALLTSFILMAVNLVVAPRFAAMYKQGKHKELERLALMSVKLMVIFALPIVALMLLFPSFLMSLFGEGFRSGAHLLQILALGQFVNVATGSVAFLLSMSGHEKDLRNTVLISGPLALILGFTLVPAFGATGSAIATAIAIATQNLIAVWWVKKRLGFNTLAVWR
jgi:O-antigen/teichoic acid export membrane protein